MELITAKIARFAPRQIATVARAVTVNAGDLRSWRRANFRSFISFGSQCLNRIDHRRAAGGQQTCKQCCCGEQNGCTAEQRRVVRGNLIELRCYQATERKRRGESDCNAPAKSARPRLPTNAPAGPRGRPGYSGSA